ncbi:MAG TPA: multiheme c-type cytochrome [Pirellulaceae bacterium]
MPRVSTAIRLSRLAPLICVALLAIGGCEKPAAQQQTTRKERGFQPGPGEPLEESTQPAVAAAPAAPPAPVASAASEPSAPADAPPPKPSFADWPKPTAVIVATGQLMGYIEPCGCSGLENQKGGLARRHTLIRQLANDRGWNVVPLDVGSQVKRFGKQQEVKFASVVQGLRTMDYQAFTLGEGDLRLTPGELLAALASNDGTIREVVDSNVAVLARDLMPRSLVVEAGGLKIGVTAVLGEKFEQRLRGDELVHQPPATALAIAMNELQSQKCDFYVLLAHAPIEEARALAKESPIFDLVIASGDTNLPTHELEAVEGTKAKLMQVGLKAMDAGVIGIYPGQDPPLRYESVPLDSRFADSPEMLKLLADYQDQLKELGLEELGAKPQPAPSGRKFVGSETCGECHAKALAKWKETPHSHATQSLVEPPNSRASIPRHFDPECISCHVTGWEPQQHYPFESGYLSLEKTPALTNVGCENCHGPGSAHVAAENSAGSLSADQISKLRESMRLPLAGEAAEKKCAECHDLDNSPEFHKDGAFERYWKKIEHLGKD